MREIDRWGPFDDRASPAERLACLRSLRAIVRLLMGPRGRDLAVILKEAERDDALLPTAALMIDRLPTIDRRHVIASYAALERNA